MFSWYHITKTKTNIIGKNKDYQKTACIKPITLYVYNRLVYKLRQKWRQPRKLPQLSTMRRGKLVLIHETFPEWRTRISRRKFAKLRKAVKKGRHQINRWCVLILAARLQSELWNEEQAKGTLSKKWSLSGHHRPRPGLGASEPSPVRSYPCLEQLPAEWEDGR